LACIVREKTQQTGSPKRRTQVYRPWICKGARVVSAQKGGGDSGWAVSRFKQETSWQMDPSRDARKGFLKGARISERQGFASRCTGFRKAGVCLHNGISTGLTVGLFFFSTPGSKCVQGVVGERGCGVQGAGCGGRERGTCRVCGVWWERAREGAHSGPLLLLLRTQLEVLAAPEVLHLDGRALLALHLKRDLLGNLVWGLGLRI